jgi:Asp/Glu/hydantoin racemase
VLLSRQLRKWGRARGQRFTIITAMASIAPMIMSAAASMIRIERFIITASNDLHAYSPSAPHNRLAKKPNGLASLS